MRSKGTDGAKLMLRGISPTVQQAHGLSTTEAVTFRQLSANAETYRDAVEFKNGVKVRLQPAIMRPTHC